MSHLTDFQATTTKKGCSTSRTQFDPFLNTNILDYDRYTSIHSPFFIPSASLDLDFSSSDSTLLKTTKVPLLPKEHQN